jgi:phosphoserine phosphatase RsbU/P
MNPDKTIAQKIEQSKLELKALLEITQAINQNVSEADLFKIFQFTLLANLQIKKLCLFMDEGGWTCKVKHGLDAEFGSPQALEPFLNIKKIREILPSDPKCFAGEFHYAIPVYHKNSLLSLVFLDLKQNGELDTIEKPLEFVQTIANVIMVAIENKRLVRKEMKQEASREAFRKELEIARNVQRKLFPRHLPTGTPITCFASYLPAKTVGGDYYDYIELEDGRHLVCIADVSGKGVPAALLMSNFQASLRILIQYANDLLEVVKVLNRQVKESADSENFITFFIAIIDPKKRQLSYVNAGHNPPILLQADGTIKTLDAGTTVLGFFDPLPFMKQDVELDLDNYLLFCYTDGLVETMTAEVEQFGIERLSEFLKENRHLPLTTLHENLFDLLNAFKKEEEFSDDITILSSKIS